VTTVLKGKVFNTWLPSSKRTTHRSKIRGVHSNMIFLSFGRGQSDGRFHLTKRSLSNCFWALCTTNRPI